MYKTFDKSDILSYLQSPKLWPNVITNLVFGYLEVDYERNDMIVLAHILATETGDEIEYEPYDVKWGECVVKPHFGKYVTYHLVWIFVTDPLLKLEKYNPNQTYTSFCRKG